MPHMSLHHTPTLLLQHPQCTYSQDAYFHLHFDSDLSFNLEFAIFWNIASSSYEMLRNCSLGFVYILWVWTMVLTGYNTDSVRNIFGGLRLASNTFFQCLFLE